MNKETEGKMTAGVLQDFLPALKRVAALGSMNNKPNGKYERGSWLKVENAQVLYLDAFWRHQLEGMYNVDPETGEIHLVAMTWNLLALLVFHLSAEEKNSKGPVPDSARDSTQAVIYRMLCVTKCMRGLCTSSVANDQHLAKLIDLLEKEINQLQTAPDKP